MVAEAGYMRNVSKQQRYFTSAKSKSRGGLPYLSIGYLLPLAVRMVASASP